LWIFLQRIRDQGLRNGEKVRSSTHEAVQIRAASQNEYFMKVLNEERPDAPAPRAATPLPLVQTEILKLALSQSEKRLNLLEQKAIRMYQKRKVDLPPIPRVASLLVSILHQGADFANLSAVEMFERQEANCKIWSEPSLKDCADLISMDACLTTTVLRYATSALHSRERIRSLDQAIMRLGLKETAEIALSLSTHALYDEQVQAAMHEVHTKHETLWQRAAIVARSARDVAKLLGRGDADLVYTSALFHGSGKALGLHLMSNLAEHNIQAQKLSPEARSLAAARMRSVLIAQYLMDEGMPQDIINTCLDVDAPISAEASDSTKIIRLTLSLVNTLLKDGHEPPNNQERAFEAAKALGMNKQQLKQIQKIVATNKKHIENIRGN